MNKIYTFCLVVLCMLLTNVAMAQWNESGAVSGGKSLRSIIKTGGDGTPYVAYVDATLGNRLSVKKFDGIDWVLVGNAGFSPGAVGYLSMDVEGSTPYVFFEDSLNNNRARVMKFDGNAWGDLGAQPLSNGKCYSNQLVAKNGKVYVSYNDANFNEKIFVKKYEGNTWSQLGPTGIFPNPMDGFSGSLAISDAEEVYLTVPNSLAGYQICTVKYDGVSAWSYVGSAYYSIYNMTNPLMAIAADGTLYSAYIEAAENAVLKVFTFDGTDWNLLGNEPVTSNYSSLLDLKIRDDVPYVYHSEAGNTSIIGYTNNSWSTVGGTLDNPWTGGNMSFSNGALFISFQDYFVGEKTLVEQYCYILPNLIATFEGESCGSGPVDLSASGGGTLYWYDASSDGNLLGSGTTFTTPTIENSTTYYVEANLLGCKSPRQGVVATIKAEPNTTIFNTGITLNAEQNNAAYQWIDCGTNQPITGATGQTFTPTSSGFYQVDVTLDGCTGMSVCAEILLPSSTTTAAASLLSIAPNPSNGIYHLNFPSSLKAESLLIYDALGQVVYQQNSAFKTLNIKELPSGIYYLQLNTKDGLLTSSLLKL